MLKQDPGPGKRVRKDGAVTLTVSKGPDRRKVPTLAGSNLDQATRALKGAELVVGAQTQEFSASVSAGSVIRSDPAAGTALKPGTAVRLVLSKGPEPVAVPDVRGKKQSDAERTLDKAGFRVTSQTVFSDTVAKGMVIEQSPFTGTATRGSTVSLVVSKGPDVVTVPRVTGKKIAEATALLQAAGLKVKVNRPFPGGPGSVLQQSPGGGGSVKRGSTVTLFVF